MKHTFKLFMLFTIISLSSFSFAKQPTRAPRTDAPADNAAIEPVPPFVCDLTQIDRLLAQIKNEVTITNNALACSTVTAITGPTTISTPGSYCLKKSFVFNGGDGIVINANDVRLNLNQNIISGNGLGGNGIVVNGSNVFIHDGFINSVVGDAIQIGNGQTKVIVDDVTVDPSTNGFALRGIAGSPITNCIIRNCNLVGTSTAITILFGQNNMVERCNIAQATGAGVLLDHGLNNIIRNNAIHDLLSFDGAESTTVAGIFTGTSEQQSKIINCNISDVLATGSAHPYGILFTNTLDVLNTVTNQFHGNIVRSANWTPDARFLAIGGDTVSGIISGIEVRVYEFDGISLTQVATTSHGADVNSVNWSPDGSYLAIGGDTPGADSSQIRVYRFNGTSLTQVATAQHGATVNSVNWSLDGRFLAIGGATGGGVQIEVYEFNGTSLTQAATSVHGVTVYSVNWSPDERFLAIGGENATADIDIRVYEFNGTSLTDIADASYGGADTIVFSVNWSPDGHFLATGGTETANGVRVYEFNGIALADVADAFLGAATVFSLNWSPTGLFLAIGGAISSTNDIRVLSGLFFAQAGIIRGNQISNVNGGPVLVPGFARGRGISASSGSNLIIQNASFNCDINYEFVTNVFRQFLVNVNSTVPNEASNLSYPPL